MSHTSSLISAAVVAIILDASATAARTWHVPNDVPTIPTAMDTASAGDSIVVGPGTYHFWQLDVKNGIVLTSERGPLETEITPSPPPILGPYHGALYCTGLTDSTEISGFYIHSFNPGLVGPQSATIAIINCQNVCIKNNILGRSAYSINIVNSYLITVENNTLFEGGLSIESGFVSVHRNIVWGFALISGNHDVTCNDFFDIDDLPYFDRAANFSADPLFCTMYQDTRRYGIRFNSPCAADNSGGCGLVGAVGVICGATPIKSSSWGSIKDIYR